MVPCKDTPNFIANRIGSFFGSTVQKLTVEDDYTIEEVDALTGPLIGLPKSASYRLLDIVGPGCVGARDCAISTIWRPHDPWRDRFVMPDFMDQMIERGWLGEKRGQGFYKRVGKGAEKEIYAIDWKTLEYHPARKSSFASVDAAQQYRRPGRAPAHARGGRTTAPARSCGSCSATCSSIRASMVPEISDRVVEIDRAMRWGYANKLGPFELWDALGFEDTVGASRAKGVPLPRERRAHAFAPARNRSTRPRTAMAPRTPSTSICCATAYQRARSAARHRGAQRHQSARAAW